MNYVKYSCLTGFEEDVKIAGDQVEKLTKEEGPLEKQFPSQREKLTKKVTELVDKWEQLKASVFHVLLLFLIDSVFL